MRGSTGSSVLVFALACVPAASDTDASTAGTTTGAGDGDTSTGTVTATGTPTVTGEPAPVCPGGDVMVETQGQLFALTGCSDIAGSLTIRGPITDLTPLAELRRVGGTLSVDTSFEVPLPSLAGLEGLESIGGLFLDGLGVVDLAPLAGLTEVPGNLWVRESEQLRSLEGLHNIRTVGDGLEIADCPQLGDLTGLRGLERIAGDVFLQGLPIVDFHGLEGLVAIEPVEGEPIEVRLTDLPQLSSAAGLSVEWDDLHVVELKRVGLTDLAMFAGTEALGGLALFYNEALADLGGLEALTVIHGGLTFIDNPALGDIAALAGLQSVGRLSLHGDVWSLDLSSFASLTTIGELFSGNRQMTDLGPFPALTQVGSVSLTYTENLVSLSGLSGLTALDELRLDGNQALVDLSGLGVLAHVAGDVEIRDNDLLADLSGLAALTAVDGRLAVIGNASLLQADAEAWAAPIAVGVSRKIGDNKNGPPPQDPCPWEDDGVCDEVVPGGLNLCVEYSDGGDCCHSVCR
ncbi:hypothetical protein [Nannocystis punicea]|uniref:Receptor L domain-containing protein n=1 Tax=Nannocystis punicea TaxID=2995304 RepID=A0ABY7GXC3_9BACT|nr:hypothetical protein [Nannocystis poenicansa]WAS91634.1 hypothetical protein O0S08_36090 [Nannocystis poenicansa]